MDNINDNNPESRKGKGWPGRFTTLMKRSSTLMQRQMYDEAETVVKEAMALFPDDARCDIQLARIYQAQNQIGPAVEAMQRAVEIDPFNSVHEQLLRTLLELGRYDEAITTSKKLLRRSPRNMFIRDVLGIVYLQQGELDKALKVTAELIRLDPADPAHHFKKAVLLQQKGMVTEAMETFVRTLDMDPGGDMADEAREAIAALDGFQLRQILSIAVEDAVFKAKLLLDPDSASRERGFLLSANGLSALRQIDLESLPGEARNRYYH